MFNGILEPEEIYEGVCDKIPSQISKGTTGIIYEIKSLTEGISETWTSKCGDESGWK